MPFWKNNNKTHPLYSVRLQGAVNTPSVEALTLHMARFFTESQGHHIKTQFSEGLGQNRPWVMLLYPRIRAKDLERAV